MECVQGQCEKGFDEGIWTEPSESLGTGNSCSGHAQENSPPKFAPMFVDKQFQPVL